MTLSTQPYKGTRDFFPADMRFRRWMFGKMRDAVDRFGFQEYDGPMLEPFELYAAKTGEEIVNQQLYWFMDRGERKLAVRPEMTPTLARLVAQKFHEIPKPVRWFSIPNLWRYERPQKGRLREHWQLNVDILGGDALYADAEILGVAVAIMKSFGGEKHTEIRVNNRRLVDHFFLKSLGLSQEVAHQTLKALDARAKIGEEKFVTWLSEKGFPIDRMKELDWFFSASFDDIAAKLPCQGADELKSLFQMLEESGSAAHVKFDASIIRGMDYYTGTVFEMYDTSPENRRAIFGGGRYDNLVGLFGKDQLSGVGFGLGDVTLQDFLTTHKLLPELGAPLDVVIGIPRADLRTSVERIAALLRAAGMRVVTPLAVSGFGDTLKLANKHQARFAVLLGEEELKKKQVLLKNLATGEQKALSEADLVSAVQ